MSKRNYWDYAAYEQYLAMDSKKEAMIADEAVSLVKRFGFPLSLTSNMCKFYNKVNSPEIGTVTKTAEFIEYVLKCYGFNDEEIINFFKKNGNVAIASYNNLRCRLAIFNHFGFLDEALFQRNGVLTSDFDNAYGIGTKSLYAVMNYLRFDSIDELKEKIKKLDLNVINRIKDYYKLDKDVIKELDQELLKKLKFMKTVNNYKKSRDK